MSGINTNNTMIHRNRNINEKSEYIFAIKMKIFHKNT